MADQGKTGWGIGSVLPPPNVTKDQMRLAAGDHTALLQAIERHLRDLAAKYVEQPMEQPQTISILGAATNFAQRLDLSTQPHNSLIICVSAGTLNLWLGDYSGIGQTALPNAGSYAAGTNQQLFLTLKGRVYTIVNPSTTIALTASIIPIAM